MLCLFLGFLLGGAVEFVDECKVTIQDGMGHGNCDAGAAATRREFGRKKGRKDASQGEADSGAAKGILRGCGAAKEDVEGLRGDQGEGGLPVLLQGRVEALRRGVGVHIGGQRAREAEGLHRLHVWVRHREDL